MNRRIRIRLTVCVVAVIGAAGLWYLTRTREAAPAKTVAPAARPAQHPAAPSSASLPPPPSAPPPAAPARAVVETAETKATDRMIAAHAPLRAPEVADPNSKENREILQTMLTKALTRKEVPPPAAPAVK